MISASKSTLSLNNLKILRLKVTENLMNLLKMFCEYPPRALIWIGQIEKQKLMISFCSIAYVKGFIWRLGPCLDKSQYLVLDFFHFVRFSIIFNLIVTF